MAATKDLRQLCDHELLLKKGDKKGTYYLAGEKLTDETEALNEEPRPLNEELLKERQHTNIANHKEILIGELPKELRGRIQI